MVRRSFTITHFGYTLQNLLRLNFEKQLALLNHVTYRRRHVVFVVNLTTSLSTSDCTYQKC